jgi:predicted PurR-regulated permease PerM
LPPSQSEQRRLLIVLGALIVLGLLFYLLSPILSPFMFAAILAYICDPIVDRLERLGLPRTLATVTVLLIMVGLFALLVLIMLPMLNKEVGTLIRRVPGYFSMLNDRVVPWLNAKLGLDLQLDLASMRDTVMRHLQGAEGLAAQVFSSIKIGGQVVLGFAINLLLVPVVTFYLLRDWDLLVAKVDSLIPRRWHPKMTEIAREIDAVLSEFLRGQLSVMLLMSAYYSAGLWLAGLDFALPVGVITGLLVFVPYLGMITGLVLATLAALLQFSGVMGLVWVWVVFGVGQLLEGMVVTPWLVGDRIGLHPVAVIFALLAFGQLFGFFGVLLALPASAALLVWLRHVQRNYLRSSIYNE